MKRLDLLKNLSSVFIYVMFLVVSTIGLIYGNVIKSEYTLLRVWEYKNIVFLFAGIPFLFLQNRANIPEFLDRNISNRIRFSHPLLIGALFGLFDVFVIKLLLHPEPYAELPPYLQPFPYSLFLFFSGAFEIEVFYRLIPVTLILLFGQWLRRGKYFNIFLYAAIIITSLREPLEQLPNGDLWFVSYSLLTGFLMNFFQANYYIKAGFLASLSLRLGHYLIWHILLGIYIQYFELV